MYLARATYKKLARWLLKEKYYSRTISILMIVPHLEHLIMSSRRTTGVPRDVPHDTISRRRLLAVGGAVAVGSLAGCLNRVASSVTNTGASPAAVFAGTNWNDDDTEIEVTVEDYALGSPHVARLTPTLGGRVELEGWVTSSAVIAQNHNSSRSNRTRGVTRSDGDSDGDDVGDADEDDELVAYLGGEPIVAERFTVCLPDAEGPGGNGSIRKAVTPERLIEYLTGQSDGGGRVYSWGTPKAGPDDPDTSNDCDDEDSDIRPGAVCGTTPHFVAEMSNPMETGDGLAVSRGSDGAVVVASSPAYPDGASLVWVPVKEDVDESPDPSEWGRSADDVPTTLSQQGRILGVFVSQVMVQPPGCPEPFPAFFYVGRGVSDGQLVYAGGWVIDDAALYEDSLTVLSMAEPTQVVGIECCFDHSADADGDGFGDVVSRAVSGERARRGARLDSGTVDELVEVGVLSEGGGKGGITIEGLGGRLPRRANGDDGEPGENYRFVTHVSVDAPVLHLVNAGSASNEVKFKAGAELSKAVN